MPLRACSTTLWPSRYFLISCARSSAFIDFLPAYVRTAKIRGDIDGCRPWSRTCTKGRGAADRNRTRNLLFTKQLLCQLSYGGVIGKGSGTLFALIVKGEEHQPARPQ